MASKPEVQELFGFFLGGFKCRELDNSFKINFDQTFILFTFFIVKVYQLLKSFISLNSHAGGVRYIVYCLHEGKFAHANRDVIQLNL